MNLQGVTKVRQEAIGLLRLDNISSVYSGKRSGCRCGCGGEYTETSFSIYSSREHANVNDKLVQKRINRAIKLLAQGAEYDDYGNCLDVKTGEDRTLTFYFDDLKPKTI